MSKNSLRAILIILIILASVLVPSGVNTRSGAPVRYGEPEHTLAPSATPTPTPTPSPTPTPAPEPTTYETLKKADKGTKPEQVTKIQERLIELGFLAGEPDGYYGDDTFAAIVQFQHVNGLERDGIAGVETQKLLFESENVRDMTGNVYVRPPVGISPQSALEPTVTPAPVELSKRDFTYGFMPDTKNYTENSYSDGGMSVAWETFEVGESRAFIAKINISDVGQLRTALCGTLERPLTNALKNQAAYYRSVIAVAGDDYAETSGIEVRQGIDVNGTEYCENDLLIIDFDGYFRIYKQASALDGYLKWKGDAYQAFSRGRALILNGIAQPDALKGLDDGFTAIGQTAYLEYVILCAEGSGDSDALMSRLIDAGCENAYMLNQGGASGVFVGGETYMQNPRGGKLVYDILYFASADDGRGGAQ